VRRVALDQLVLRIKALGLPGAVSAVCNELVEPPDPAAVLAAVRELASIGALQLRRRGGQPAGEALTALGRALTQLPVDARLGKLLLLGCGFGAVDEALTIASALAARSPFLSPMDAREAADASKRGFARDAAPVASTRGSYASPYGAAADDQRDGRPSSGSGDSGRLPSDLLAVRQAYFEFDARGNNDRGCAFARERLLGIKSLLQMGTLKRQLLEALSGCIGRHHTSAPVPPGLRQSGLEGLGRRHGSCDGVRPALDQWRAQQEADAQPREERNRPREASAELLAALVGAALFPQVAYVDAPFKKAKGGAPAVPCGPEAVKLLVRDPAGALLEPGSKACVHPSSVGAKLGGAAWPSPFVAFHERVLTTKVRAHEICG
jgi:HrpA-like RNA helicase